MIDTTLFIASLPRLLYGAGISLIIALGALCIGAALGTLLAFIELYAAWPLRMLVRVYTTIFRGTPMLIQIVFLYYLLHSIVNVSAFTCAIISIGLNSSAYVSQIMKAGIRSISSGQIEAAYTLGISRNDLIRYIVLPQAIRTVLPALGNEMVTLVKDTSLASVIGVTELYTTGKNIIAHTYDSITIYCAIALIYIAITVTLSWIIEFIERKLHAQHTKSF